MAFKAKRSGFLKSTVLTLLACSLSSTFQPVLACGPFYDEAVFSATIHPDLPFRLYADGNLALVEPTFARSYLVVAYRYLNNKPLSSSEREQILNFWRFRLGDASRSDSDNAVDLWLTTRNKALGIKPSDSSDRLYPYRSAGSNDDYNPYLNCNDDAFKQAVKTLQEKVAKYGAGSAAVKDWLAAQDSVFCHCSAPQYDYKTKAQGKEPPLPSPAAADASEEVKRERAYQIASANFYAKNFDEAAKQFGAIALDSASPYQKISAYLVARCLIRKATVSTNKGIDQVALLAAHNKLLELQADPAMTSMKEGIEGLLNFVGLRLDPAVTLQQLSKKIAAGDSNLYQDMDGYIYILDSAFKEDSEDASTTHSVDDTKLAAAMHGDDMTDWIWTFSNSDKNSLEHALSRYKEKKNDGWLLCVGSKLTGKEPYASEILEALAKIEKSSPAYVTANSQRARVLTAQGHNDQAVSAIDSALGATKSPSAMNALNLQKLMLSKSLEQMITLSYRSPALIVGDAESQTLSSEWQKLDQKKTDGKTYTTLPTMLRPEGAVAINQKLPLNLFLQAAQSQQVPAALRKDIAQAVFCRSVLLHDQNSSNKASALLKQYMPNLASQLARYDSAGADSKEFSAAFLMLKYPGIRPYVTAGVGRTTEFGRLDDYQDNWWISIEADKAVKFAGQQFLKPADLAKAKAEVATINSLSTGPNYLGKVTIDYARKHLSDPRVPEALHMVVRATKLGASNDKTSAISKQAFQILHQNYKGNPWTVKTPYYY
ncbi:MAG: hypothetical protein WC028_03445 [Candidatus Obscuribacterales bacterium]